MLKEEGRICILLIALLFLFSSAAHAGSADLEHSRDPQLQRGLQARLQALHLDQAARQKTLAVALVDITDPASPRAAYVNPNEMMYAASLPKIAILLGAFERISRGEMALDAATRRELEQMIRFSSNRAATDILNRVGKAYLARLLQSPRYRLYDPRRNGGLWVGKDYGPAPAWRRDPLHHLSHGATALQVARFYYLLETGRLVSPRFSRTMKSILAQSGIHHKFVRGLESAGLHSRIYRKSGTWKSFHADSAIVEHNGRRYIAVALAHDARGEQWLRRLIVAMDRLICRDGAALRVAMH